MLLLSSELNTLKSVQDKGLAKQQSPLDQPLDTSFIAGINDLSVVRIDD